jgi:hypothetical protein
MCIFKSEFFTLEIPIQLYRFKIAQKEVRNFLSVRYQRKAEAIASVFVFSGRCVLARKAGRKNENWTCEASSAFI